MKKMLCALALGAMLVIAINQGCSKIDRPEKVISSAASSGIDEIKKWFYGQWQPPKASIAARTSPWLHDTSFITNNFSNIIPDWRLARVYYRDSVKFTEVPVMLPDTLQFKIGPNDSAQFLNAIIDSVYCNLPQSKIFWIAKEEPGQDPYAEIVTFVSDYEYAKADYQRFLNGVSYFDMDGYTGMVTYYDRNGQLLRAFQYLRGDIVNTIRCGNERGLCPAPDNRVHLDACYEILTWERDCVTTYDQNGIGQKECGEWFLVGSHMVGNCSSNSGGGSGAASYDPYSENGIDCHSFVFSKTTTANWQEAGVKDIVLKTVWIGPTRAAVVIDYKLTTPVVFGLPIERADGTIYTPGMAATIAAQAESKAIVELNRWAKYLPVMPSNSEIEIQYRNFLKMFMLAYGGTADKNGSHSPNIIYKTASYKLLGNGKCR